MKARSTVATQPARPFALTVIDVFRRIFFRDAPAPTPTFDLESLPLAKPLAREEIAARQREGRVAEISE